MFLRSKLLASALTTFVAITLVAPPADAAPKVPPKDPIAVGLGGAVSSVDPYATEIGLNVLKRGGNAVDAAVATAAALGVTINAIAIETLGNGVADFYVAELVTPGGFVARARGHGDYPRAIRAKILRELATPIG